LISYGRVPEDGGNITDIRTLIEANDGLQHPQGIAVDQKRKRLYIADPDVRSIFSYQLIYKGNELSTDGQKTVISRQAESRWVAVDGVGNVFFSDEPRNLILKVPAEKALRGEPTAEVLYSGSSLAQLNAPGGIAVDNFHVYWTNKHLGTEVGSVVRGSEFADSNAGPDTVSVLARNTAKSYGICTALGNIYYTDSSRRVYGVKKAGGPAVEVSSSLQSPRGCAWDGDGTVFVADRSQNAVFAFAGEMRELGEARLTKAFRAEDAFGLAVAVDASSAADSTPRLMTALFGAAVAAFAAVSQ
jgi:sugar lactone lactonase YvrE